MNVTGAFTNKFLEERFIEFCKKYDLDITDLNMRLCFMEGILAAYSDILEKGGNHEATK